jgi:hypothetical protein
MTENPWMTFFILLGIAASINVSFRTLLILWKGYPPEYCDVFGNFREDSVEIEGEQ